MRFSVRIATNTMSSWKVLGYLQPSFIACIGYPFCLELKSEAIPCLPAAKTCHSSEGRNPRSGCCMQISGEGCLKFADGCLLSIAPCGRRGRQSSPSCPFIMMIPSLQPKYLQNQHFCRLLQYRQESWHEVWGSKNLHSANKTRADSETLPKFLLRVSPAPTPPPLHSGQGKFEPWAEP